MDHPTKTPEMRELCAWMRRDANATDTPYDRLVLIAEGSDPRKARPGRWVRVPWLDGWEIRVDLKLEDDGHWTANVPVLDDLPAPHYKGYSLEDAYEGAQMVAGEWLGLEGIDPERIIWLPEA